jgi:hypothetical protein
MKTVPQTTVPRQIIGLLDLLADWRSYRAARAHSRLRSEARARYVLATERCPHCREKLFAAPSATEPHATPTGD